MKKTFHSVRELQEEIRRLENMQHVIEADIKNHYHQLAHALRPMNLIKSAFHAAKHDEDITQTIKSKGGEALFGLLFSKAFVKSSNPLLRTVAGIAGSLLASTVFGEHSGKYLDKIARFFRKITHRDSKEQPTNPDSKFNEADIYKP